MITALSLPSRILSPIDVTLSGIKIFSREKQSSKANLPIVLTVSGIVSSFIPVSRRSSPQISSIPSANVTSVRAVQPPKGPLRLRTTEPSSDIYPEPASLIEAGRCTDVIPVQSPKAFPPRTSTLSGSVTSVRDLQPKKASSPIFFKLSGSVISSREVHSAKAESPISVKLSGQVIFFR